VIFFLIFKIYLALIESYQAQGQFYAMSKLLELWKPIRPTLGYSYSFELIEDEKDYFVRVMFKTNITSSVLPVKIDG
jgi:hypothetical protein